VSPAPAPSPVAVMGARAASMPSHRTEPTNVARSGKPTEDRGAIRVDGCDLFALRAPADHLLRPLRHRLVQVNRETPDHADVHSATVHHAEATSARQAVDDRSLLVVVGLRGAVGGQEDVITDLALDLLITQEAAA